MTRIDATERITIEQPLPLVRSHFGDVGYHQASGVHPDVAFELIDDDGTTCTYRQTTKTGPISVRQELRLDRSDPDSLVNTITGGAFAGGTLRFTFAGTDAGATEVTAEFSGTAAGPAALVAPLVRRRLAASLRKALGEDRADLEANHYPGPESPRREDRP